MTERSHVRSRFVLVAFTFIVIAYSLMDNIAPRGVLYWRMTFALFYVALVAVASYALFAIRRSEAYSHATYYAFFVFLYFSFIYGLTAEEFYAIYFFGDFALISTILLMIFILSRTIALIDMRYVFLVSSALILASFLSYLSSRLNLVPAHDYGPRFDAPKAFAYAGLAVCIARGRGWMRMASVALIAAAVVLAFLSTWRAELGFVGVAIAYALTRYSVLHQGRLLTVIACMLGAVLVISQFGSIYGFLNDSLEETRFSTLLQGGGDESFGNRILEVIDVLTVFRTEASLMQWLFGFGHGAVYMPVYSFPEPNITEGFFVHNIHISLIMFLYRYGMLGAALYLAFCYLSVQRVVRSVFTRKFAFVEEFSCLFAFLITLRSIFYSPVNDPVNIIGISLFLFVLMRSPAGDRTEDRAKDRMGDRVGAGMARRA